MVRTERSSGAVWPIAVGIVGIVTMLPVCGHEFVLWDDPHNFYENPDMLAPSWAGLGRFWTAPYKDLYVPLTQTLWMATAVVARHPTPEGGVALNPYIFHVLNVALHAASACLVWAILQRLCARPWAAAAGAMLFAVHPLQVEAVAWASGLKDLLGGMLSLAAIWLYLSASPTEPALARPTRRLALSAAIFLLAMLSKPSTVVVPLLILAIELLVRLRTVRQIAWPVGVGLLLALPFAYIARSVQQADAMEFAPTLAQRAVVAADALAFYTGKLIAPAGLCIDYGRSPQSLLSSSAAWWTWIVPLAIAAGTFVLRRRATFVLAGIGVLVMGLLPTLGLVPFDFQAYSTVADHYVYLAMLGPALLLAGAMDRWRSPIAPTTCALGLAVLAIVAHTQTWNWADSQTLFTHTLSVNPASLAANVNLGRLHADAAQHADRMGDARAAESHARRAIELTERALRVSPHDFQAHTNLGNMRLLLRDLPAAERHYRITVQRHPRSAEARTRLGAVLAMQGSYRAAIEQFQAALSLDPRYAFAQRNLDLARKRLTTRTSEDPSRP